MYIWCEWLFEYYGLILFTSLLIVLVNSSLWNKPVKINFINGMLMRCFLRLLLPTKVISVLTQYKSDETQWLINAYHCIFIHIFTQKGFCTAGIADAISKLLWLICLCICMDYWVIVHNCNNLMVFITIY